MTHGFQAWTSCAPDDAEGYHEQSYEGQPQCHGVLEKAPAPVRSAPQRPTSAKDQPWNKPFKRPPGIIVDVKVKLLRPKAVLVIVPPEGPNPKEIWVPRALIQDDAVLERLGVKCPTITVSKKIAEEKGLLP